MYQYSSNSVPNPIIELSQQNHEKLQKIANDLLWRTQIDYLSRWHTKSKINDADLQLIKPTISKNGKSQLVFPQASSQIYLTTNIEIPQAIEGICFKQGQIYLDVIWWAQDITIYADGEIIQQGDLLDQQANILLIDLSKHHASFDQDYIKLEITLESPNHDIGALQRSIIRYRLPQEFLALQSENIQITGDLYQFYQELMILGQFISKFTDVEQQILANALTAIETILNSDLEASSLIKIESARQQLLPLVHHIQRVNIYLLGNSHIDVAWLWTIAETKEVMQRTFNSTINLQQQFPAMTFNQSTAISYAWIAEIDPNLWQSIKQMVAANRWEVIGGMWVEPDANVPSGESIIRQILYGKQYFATHFNQDVTVAWLPDTFGFAGQLPQILIDSGFTLFITQKIKWNDTNIFPHQLFWWEGIDHSQILTYFSNDIGKGTNAVEIMDFATAQMAKTQINDVLWLYGVGDHGGGATAGMLHDLNQWEQSLFAPQIHHCLAKEFAQILMENIAQTAINLPVHQGELYLEFHRGTYTSKADQKRHNRLTEIKITNIEKLLVLLQLSNNNFLGLSNHLKQQINDLLTQSWQGLLLNQFHDILPGTSICEVYDDANQTWLQVNRNLDFILELVSNLNLNLDQTSRDLSNSSTDKICNVYNYLNWGHSGFIYLDSSAINSLQDNLLQDNSNTPTKKPETYIQQIGTNNYLVWVDKISSLSNQKLTQIQLTQPLQKLKIYEYATEIILDNHLLRVTINRHLGAISQIFDHRLKRNLLCAPITLQFFQDTGQYWDAWNIDPNYEQFLLDLLSVHEITIIESGSLRLAVKISTKFQDSTFEQIIYLDAFRPVVTISNSVEWQEKNILVKVAFPVNWHGSFATYDIPMGTIERSTLAENSIEQAKFEVPAQFWADLSDDQRSIGLSIINDCKYGYDAKPDQLRLTLLRSPQWPCTDADTGHHEFTYQIVPHSGDWRAANIPRLAHELNNPLVLNKLPEALSFLEISAPNIILTALKSAENGNGYIMRFYETFGVTTNCQFTIKLKPSLTITSIELCNLLELPHTKINNYLSLSDNAYQFISELSPYKIITICIILKDSA